MKNTINTAIAQANRFDRAQNIIAEGYKFTVENSGSVAVCKPGRLAASYWISDNECDCPDFLRNCGPCKHMMAWEIIKAEEESMEAQCEMYDNAECANGVDYLL